MATTTFIEKTHPRLVSFVGGQCDTFVSLFGPQLAVVDNGLVVEGCTSRVEMWLWERRQKLYAEDHDVQTKYVSAQLSQGRYLCTVTGNNAIAVRDLVETNTIFSLRKNWNAIARFDYLASEELAVIGFISGEVGMADKTIFKCRFGSLGPPARYLRIAADGLNFVVGTSESVQVTHLTLLRNLFLLVSI
jgi:hypothetical protein